MSENQKLMEVRDAAYFYLKFRPRTKKEVERHLFGKAEKKNWPDEVILQVIEQLVCDGYIDDTAFVDWFVTSRARNKPKSTYALNQELRTRGVSKEVIDEYFSHAPIPEDELAHQALQKRWRRYDGLKPETRDKKAVDFLRSRGFSWDIARRAVAKCKESE